MDTFIQYDQSINAIHVSNEMRAISSIFRYSLQVWERSSKDAVRREWLQMLVKQPSTEYLSTVRRFIISIILDS